MAGGDFRCSVIDIESGRGILDDAITEETVCLGLLCKTDCVCIGTGRRRRPGGGEEDGQVRRSSGHDTAVLDDDRRIPVVLDHDAGLDVENGSLVHGYVARHPVRAAGEDQKAVRLERAG